MHYILAMEPITKDNDDPSHIWTKEEIIECGLCINEEEPDFERDEVNDIISVGGQDEYDADPDVLVDDTNDFEDDNISSIIHEEKEENIEQVQEPTVELVVEPVQEPILEPVVEPAQEPILEPVLDIVLPFNIEKKEENEKEEKEEQEEKVEPDANVVVNRLALDVNIIEESAPKDIIVDENNLPFIHEEKEETLENQVVTDEVTVEATPVEPNVEEPLKIIIPTIIDNERNVQSAEPVERHETLTRRDNATFEAPSAKKFKWKAWFQSLWFWT